jgi:hypothetical protein
MWVPGVSLVLGSLSLDGLGRRLTFRVTTAVCGCGTVCIKERNARLHLFSELLALRVVSVGRPSNS